MYFGDRHGLVPNSHTGKLSQIYVSGLPVSVPELSARGLVKGLGWLLWCLWLILAFQLLKAQIPVVGPGSIVTGVFANQTEFHQGDLSFTLQRTVGGCHSYFHTIASAIFRPAAAGNSVHSARRISASADHNSGSRGFTGYRVWSPSSH